MTDCLLVGDVHISDRSPSSRTSTYKQDILDKLVFCVEKANELDVPIVQGGDLFHIKAPTKNSHKLVQDVHEVLSKCNNGVWVVPGNHDLSYDRLDSLEKQPLGSLARMSNVSLLMGCNSELPGIAGVPYLTEFDGGNWKDACDEWACQIEYAELLITHAPIFPPGQAPKVYFSIDPYEWAQYWIGIPVTFYSHIHDYHGVYEVEVFRTRETESEEHLIHTFCNQGALSRGSLHESSINRKPAITYWHDGTFERIEVPHKPADEVFIFEKAIEKIEIQAAAQSFADALGSVNLDVLTVEEIRARLREQTSDPKVIEVIEDVLDAVL